MDDVLGNVAHSLGKVADGDSNPIFPMDVGRGEIGDTTSYRDFVRGRYFRPGMGEFQDE